MTSYILYLICISGTYYLSYTMLYFFIIYVIVLPSENVDVL